MKPVISFIAPSHRTWLWKDFYRSVVQNVVPFEVIFVSDIEPKKGEAPLQEFRDNYLLKNDFKYIISPVKPAQCFEIAYRQSRGDYIIWTGDDFRYSPYALDNALTMLESFYDHKVMISFDVFEDGEEATKRCHKVPWDEKIQLTTSALISKKAIEEVGGLADINFVSGHWDVDLQLRIRENGGRLFVCPTAIAYEPHIFFHRTTEANFAIDWKEELEYFTSLWKLPDNTTAEHRLKPFTPYKSDNILTISQGNIGKSNKWH